VSAARKERARLDPAKDLNWSLRSAAFSPDDALVVAGDDNGSAHIWEVATGKELRTLHTKQQNPVYTAEFSPDGKLVVAGGAGPQTYVWEAATGQTMAVLQQHGDSVNAAEFSPDGRLILTASDDRTAKLYPCETCGSVDSLLALADERDRYR
jgi:WD40 repeat protein